jgi:hypothetical protein
MRLVRSAQERRSPLRLAQMFFTSPLRYGGWELSDRRSHRPTLYKFSALSSLTFASVHKPAQIRPYLYCSVH